jgi:hypothetical protein
MNGARVAAAPTAQTLPLGRHVASSHSLEDNEVTFDLLTL